MNIVLLNGSPRAAGNTTEALKMLAEALPAGSNVETVNVAALKIGGCKSCFACKQNGGTCVQKDDAEEVLAKVVAADALVFATPVYFMGITAQLKALIDRFFAKVDKLQAASKKVAVIAIGGTPPPSGQYDLIAGNVQAICAFLGWEFAGQYVAGSFQGDEAKTAAAKKEIAALAAKL
ncbi:MAG: flavodoxin family protein [Firmicutes bacterium]|nr:flavodoxin family protein [Bacillota bacterium]